MSQEDQHKQRKKSLASIQKYKDVFGSPNGKKVLHDLMKEGHMLDTSVQIQDPYVTAFNEGRRSMVLYIIGKLNIDIAKLDQRIKEGIEHDNRDDF